jgi:anti-sigma factor ChrR (cupin superfamily)
VVQITFRSPRRPSIFATYGEAAHPYQLDVARRSVPDKGHDRAEVGVTLHRSSPMAGQPVIDSTFPLAQTSAAQARMEAAPYRQDRPDRVRSS